MESSVVGCSIPCLSLIVGGACYMLVLKLIPSYYLMTVFWPLMMYTPFSKASVDWASWRMGRPVMS